MDVFEVIFNVVVLVVFIIAMCLVSNDKEHWYNKSMTDTNIKPDINDTIPLKIREIFDGHLDKNDSLSCQHNLQILDEIISDLKKYQRTLPSVWTLDLDQPSVV